VRVALDEHQGMERSNSGNTQFEPRALQGVLLGLLVTAILWAMIGSLGWWLCH